MAYMDISELKPKLQTRFLRYVSVGTQSDPEKADAGVMPSTEEQRLFAESLKEELALLGIEASVDENSYLFARIPASPGKEELPAFGLCSHLDTASNAPGSPVHPIVHKDYDGGIITLPSGAVLDPETEPALKACAGGTIITSDGNTLLGADDKAGIAGIMTLAEFLVKNESFAHGPIEILFSPDEETGHGMDRVPLSKMKAKTYYTVDGSDEGEIEGECFNAWKCSVRFCGRAAHLGTAKGRLINAGTMAASFVAMLPQAESPEATEGREGYYCPLDISGSLESAEVSVFIRDFEREGIERRIECVRRIAQAVEAAFPGGSASVEAVHQYSNMRDKLAETPAALDFAIKAAEQAGVTPRMTPIRGGTDGSRLTEMGIPTPNIFTGGHNFHSRTEWASLEQMMKMTETLINLVALWS